MSDKILVLPVRAAQRFEEVGKGSLKRKCIN